MMLQKFKVECGLNIVNKMTQMFKDMELSKDIQADFRKHCNGANAVEGVEFATEVLTNGNWPIDDPIVIQLPTQLKQCQAKFETYYKNKHQNRLLKWLLQNGQVEMVTIFTGAKRY